MSEELKPCPFCHGPGKLWRPNESGDFVPLCDAGGCWATLGAYGTEKEAAAAWNRRATHQEVMREIMDCYEAAIARAKWTGLTASEHEEIEGHIRRARSLALSATAEPAGRELLEEALPAIRDAIDALEDIAKQKLPDEMGGDTEPYADYENGYKSVVQVARATLSKLRTALGEK